MAHKPLKASQPNSFIAIHKAQRGAAFGRVDGSEAIRLFGYDAIGLLMAYALWIVSPVDFQQHLGTHLLFSHCPHITVPMLAFQKLSPSTQTELKFQPPRTT